MAKTIDNESKIESMIKKMNLSFDEAKHIIEQLRKPDKVRKSYDHFFNSKHIKIGVLGDTHIGSDKFDYQTFKNSIQKFKDVDAIYHAGDLIEGMSNREGHVYELEKIGTTPQLNLAGELLSEYKKPFYFICGNHDLWAKKKSDQGVLIGPTLEDKIDGSKYLGDYSADINLSKNVKLRLTHEGTTSYALSYSTQKRVNAISGGEKPDIILNGHIHKFLYMFYRNIHCFEVGCIQSQTDFMKMKGSPAMVGFWVLDLYFNKKGINEIVPHGYPSY